MDFIDRKFKLCKEYGGFVRDIKSEKIIDKIVDWFFCKFEWDFMFYILSVECLILDVVGFIIY